MLGVTFGKADTVSRISEDENGYIEALDECDRIGCLGIVCHMNQKSQYMIYRLLTNASRFLWIDS